MATKKPHRFSVGDTVYLINKLFLIHEAVVVEVIKSDTCDLLSKVDYRNGAGDMFVADAKAVLATAENYDHLTAIFGADAFIFPNDQPTTSISNHYQNLYDEPKIHRISRWADGSVSEVTQSTKHAQITITAPTKAERLTLMGKELANVMREHQTTQLQE